MNLTHKKISIASAVVATSLSALVACGDEITNINETVAPKAFASSDSIPECSNENVGEMIVSDEADVKKNLKNFSYFNSNLK